MAFAIKITGIYGMGNVGRESKMGVRYETFV